MKIVIKRFDVYEARINDVDDFPWTVTGNAPEELGFDGNYLLQKELMSIYSDGVLFDSEQGQFFAYAVTERLADDLALEAVAACKRLLMPEFVVID